MGNGNMEDEKRDTFCEKNYRRAKYFFDNKIPVHVVDNFDSFFNGYLFEVNTDIIKIHDRKVGLKTVFFFDLKKDIVEFNDNKGDK